nr:1353_t:CDS:2 [Entrophospora candida]CAG8620246.1 4117_t:CDS:2 [Entrophospora candida]
MASTQTTQKNLDLSSSPFIISEQEDDDALFDAILLEEYMKPCNLPAKSQNDTFDDSKSSSMDTQPLVEGVRRSANGNSIPIPAMKMKEAWLCHLPLRCNSSHKPSLYGCDSSNCFITKTTITEETEWVLPCGHAYHNTCFNQDGSKCLCCLDFIKGGVDKHVQSLLEVYIKLI